MPAVPRDQTIEKPPLHLRASRRSTNASYCRRVVRGDTQFTYCFMSVTFVGHAVNEINDLWRQIVRTQVVRTARNSIGYCQDW